MDKDVYLLGWSQMLEHVKPYTPVSIYANLATAREEAEVLQTKISNGAFGYHTDAIVTIHLQRASSSECKLYELWEQHPVWVKRKTANEDE